MKIVKIRIPDSEDLYNGYIDGGYRYTTVSDWPQRLDNDINTISIDIQHIIHKVNLLNQAVEDFVNFNIDKTLKSSNGYVRKLAYKRHLDVSMNWDPSHVLVDTKYSKSHSYHIASQITEPMYTAYIGSKGEILGLNHIDHGWEDWCYLSPSITVLSIEEALISPDAGIREFIHNQIKEKEDGI